MYLSILCYTRYIKSIRKFTFYVPIVFVIYSPSPKFE
nr:MAG TPA: hypothetical protein [Caudoviricetes sp.]